MSLTRFFLAAALLVGATGVQAQEGTSFLTGTFIIDIYNGALTEPPGNSTDPREQALAGNPLGTPQEGIPVNLLITGPRLSRVTYNGALDFAITASQGPTSTIRDFLDTGTGSYTGLATSTGNLTLSSPPFDITTVFVITFTRGAISGLSIDHDDGIGLYVNNTLVTDPANAAPTPEVTTEIGGTGGGTYTLVYVAANGNPSVLRARGIEPQPDFVGFGCQIDLTQTSIAPAFGTILSATGSEKFCPQSNGGVLKLGCSGNLPGYSAESTVVFAGSSVVCRISGSQCGLSGEFAASVKSISVGPGGFTRLDCEATPPGPG
jgi:hypothetical protein